MLYYYYYYHYYWHTPVFKTIHFGGNNYNFRWKVCISSSAGIFFRCAVQIRNQVCQISQDSVYEKLSNWLEWLRNKHGVQLCDYILPSSGAVTVLDGWLAGRVSCSWKPVPLTLNGFLAEQAKEENRGFTWKTVVKSRWCLLHLAFVRKWNVLV